MPHLHYVRSAVHWMTRVSWPRATVDRLKGRRVHPGPSTPLVEDRERACVVGCADARPACTASAPSRASGWNRVALALTRRSCIPHLLAGQDVHCCRPRHAVIDERSNAAAGDGPVPIRLGTWAWSLHHRRRSPHVASLPWPVSLPCGPWRCRLAEFLGARVAAPAGCHGCAQPHTAREAAPSPARHRSAATRSPGSARQCPLRPPRSARDDGRSGQPPSPWKLRWAPSTDVSAVRAALACAPDPVTARPATGTQARVRTPTCAA